jgi:hypothetical protein
MEFLLAAKERCRHLVVGITNPDPGAVRATPLDPVRGTAAANPLTYYERMRLIDVALRGEGVPSSDYTIVPFPIGTPHMVPQYVDISATAFTTVYDAWGREKAALLAAIFPDVVVMWERTPEEKPMSGVVVRKIIVEGGPWEELVPSSAAKLMHELALVEKVRRVCG